MPMPRKSMDVLGQAARLVVPFQASDGHTMYRARFGLFAERQAREVCDRLTQRGQTCLRHRRPSNERLTLKQAQHRQFALQGFPAGPWRP